MNYAFLVVPLLACQLSPGDWLQFRGGAAAGVSEERGLPDSWSKSKNVVWKTEIPGRGWSAPVVCGNKVFLTSVIRDGKMEDAKKGLYMGGERFRPPTDIPRVTRKHADA